MTLVELMKFAAEWNKYTGHCYRPVEHDAHLAADGFASALLKLLPVLRLATEVRRGRYSVRARLTSEDRALFDEFNLHVDAMNATLEEPK